MNLFKWPVTYYFLLWMMLVACNNNGNVTTPARIDTTSLDSSRTVIKDSLPAQDSVAERESFIKRDINLTPARWQAFLNMHQLKADLDHGAGQVAGDFDGDGKREILYVIGPKADTITKDAFQECIGGCDTYLVSLDTGFTILKVHSNLGGEAKNIGDIDGDGADDIMVYPSWWQSNWNPYRVYSVNRATRQWTYLIEPVSIFANELEKNISFVKQSTKPGFISAYTTTVDEDGDFHSGYKDFKIIK